MIPINYSNLRHACALAIASFGLPTLALAQTAGDSERPRAQLLEEIVVTAQYREQSLQSVPLSITALDMQALDALGAVNFEDFARTVPGLDFSNLGPGRDRYTIRGVSTFSGVSVVGIYLDNSPIASPINFAQPTLALHDLERVEVLRGPQGTLIGEGALGGTIRYITASPRLDQLEAGADLTLSNTERGGTNYRVQGMFNAPLLDNTAALRLSGLHHDNSGYIDNVTLNRSNVNDLSMTAFRGKLLFQPGDRWALELSLLNQKIDQTGNNVETFDRPVGSLENTDPVIGSFEDSFYQAAATLRYALPQADLAVSTAYFDRSVDSFSVSRGTSFPQPLVTDADVDYKVWTHEANLVSSQEGALQWLIGAFYKDFELGEFVSRTNVATGAPIPNANPRVERNFEQIALFGEIEYAFTDRLYGTLGLRWFSEDQSLTDARGRFEVSANEIITRFVLRYEFTDDHMAYVSATEGFRSGGVNPFTLPEAATTFNPDTTWNYEVGARLRLFERQLLLNLTAYRIDWSDLQTFIPRPDLGPFVFFIENNSAAKVDGVEAELVWTPDWLDRFSAGGMLSYTNARLTEDALLEGGARGAKLPKVPRWTGSAFVSYDFPLNSTWTGYTRADYQYHGSFPELLNNLDISGNYAIVNLRGGVRTDRLQLEVFVENLDDTRADLFQRRTVEFGMYRNRPRTYGITARWRM